MIQCRRRRWRLAVFAGAAILLFAGCLEGNPDPYSAEDREPTGPGAGPGVDADPDEEEDQDVVKKTAVRDRGPEGSGSGPVVFIA